jgi:glycosyltransferase involved in cell wall biosynthesis
VKVAFIGQKGIPATYGGVERHVEELAVRLAAGGIRPCVYNRRHYNDSPPTTYRGVDVVTLPSVATKHLDAISHVAVCTAHAIGHKADVIHYHAVGPALLSWVPRVAGVPTVVTVHGRDWQRPKWGGVASAALRAGEWTAMHAPDETIVVSSSLARELSAKYGRHARYIPNGITLEETEDPTVLAELGVEPGGYVLFASRLVPEKGAHYLAEAWLGQRTDMRLVMAGDSSFSSDYVEGLRATCRRGGGRIVLPGYVFGPRLAALFRHAALFVLPSDIEGLPIVLLEALGYGTPVLASEIPPNLEVLDGRGRTFHAGDVQDLARQLEAALGDLSALQEEATRSAASVIAAYDWDEVTRQTAAVYEGLAARRRS